MKKKLIKNILGLTLVEILIVLVVSSMMMAAMYTTYSIVNATYGQVVDKAHISRSSRDLIELLIRDVRMAGFKYYLGTNSRGFPEESYLQVVDANTIQDSHAPIIIEEGLDHVSFVPDANALEVSNVKNNPGDLCCDKIHIVYDDFDQNDENQPYKKYKISYYARPTFDPDPEDPENVSKRKNLRYGVYKSKIYWQQRRATPNDPWPPTGRWIGQDDGCEECYHHQLIRDFVEDMEFVAIDRDGKRISPFPEPTNESNKANLYKIRSIDIKLTFRSEKEFFRFEARDGAQRKIFGFSRSKENYTDRYLRDTVAVTVYTRNIVDEGLF